LPDEAPAWLRLTGMLPPGRPGDVAWQEERGKVAELLAAIAEPVHPAHALFAAALPEARPVAIDRCVGGRHLRGELRDVFMADGARWVLRIRPGKHESDLAFKDRIGLFLDWALLRLVTDRDVPVRTALITSIKAKKPGTDPWSTGFTAWDRGFRQADRARQDELLADLERRVAGLADFFVAAMASPTWYFPRTSWTALAGEVGRTSRTWRGDGYGIGERDYAPGYAALLAGDRDFGEEADFDLLYANARHLEELIRVDVPSAEIHA